MALNQAYLKYIHESIVDTLGGLKGKTMLELGNQEIRDKAIPEKIGKEYFENRGVEHTSIDLNGLDGALKLDLTKPEQFMRWHGYFDIVTNAGTSEHVEPKPAQYECFLIMHNCLRVGGVIIHLVPDAKELKEKGCRKGHCTNFYSHEFFIMLANSNGYKVVSLRMIDGLLCACLQKTALAPFMKNRSEFLKHIERSRGGIVYPGINVHGPHLLLFYAKRLIRKLMFNLTMRH